jgi:hypothetical protein
LKLNTHEEKKKKNEKERQKFDVVGHHALYFNFLLHWLIWRWRAGRRRAAQSECHPSHCGAAHETRPAAAAE